MITPELEAIRELIRSMRLAVQPDLATRRADMDLTPTYFEVPKGVTAEDVRIAGRPARWQRPDDGDATRALLYLHGGAYVTGSLESHREICARLALALGAPVLALDYRLAPEHPFPAAIDDAVAAWRWLVTEGDIDPRRAAIAGDSAGGGLAMATLLSLRDAGDPLPGAAALLSPWTDLDCASASYTERADLEIMLDRQFLLADAARYLGGADPGDPLASPIGADLAGLPPVIVHVGTDEVLYDDSVVLHDRLVAAGVESRLDVWPDMFHVWHGAPVLAEANEAMGQIAQFIAKHTSG